MPVTVEWLDEDKTIVCMHMIGHWTWGEVHEKQAEANLILDTLDHDVGAIIDFTESAGIPLAAMSNARSTSQKQHPRVSMTVFVGVNSLFMALWSAFSKVYSVVLRQHQFQFAKDMDEAKKMLSYLALDKTEILRPDR
jgi:hypothetical protein